MTQAKFSSEKEYLTQEKYDQLQEELKHLKHKKRSEIAERLDYAKSLGDLSENAEYNEAREAQAELEERIRHLEQVLQNAEIVSHADGSVVGVGSEVTVRPKGSKKKTTFTVVGSEEADFATSKISYKSPLGQAVFGNKKGDEVEFKAPSGPMTYVIEDVK